MAPIPEEDIKENHFQNALCGPSQTSYWIQLTGYPRVRVIATNITKDSFKASLNCWGDTTLYFASASWLELSPGHLEYQSGEFCTVDDHPWNKPQMETPRRIIFDRPFITPPKVIVFLKQLDMANDKSWLVATKVSGIDPNGFTIHIDTWGDSILYSAGAGWIAYPEDRPYVFSGTASTTEIGPSDKPRLKTSKAIDIRQAWFLKAPNVFMAINSLNLDHRANLRIKVEATHVTQNSLTWHIDSWGDSILYDAGVSILAVV